MPNRLFVSRQMTAAMDRRDMIRLTLLAGLATAATLTVPARAANSAVESVTRFANALVALTQSGGTPFAQRFAQFAPNVDQTFDLGAILRTSVGPQWDAMSAAEQADLMRVFRQYTVASFVANFDKYKGAFRLGSERDVPGGGKVVDGQIGDTTLGFVMRQAPDGWRIVDVLADGAISRVATQRSDFRSTLLHGGGPALLASLRRKVSDLSGGSLA